MPVILNIFGDLERLIADDLYPYRYVITPLLVAGLLAAGYVAYRQGLHLLLWRNKLPSLLIGGPLLVVAVFVGYYLLSPLWERSSLYEASPLEAAGLATPVATATAAASAPPEATATLVAPPPAAGPDAPATAEPAASGAAVTHQGEFEGSDEFHFGRGTALIIATDDGNVLRVEDFSVRNGPDLFVYLSTDPTGESVEEALNLGDLKATDGAFNYEIPDDVNLDEIASVVVWCRQFGVLFAHAPLSQ